VSGVVLLLSPPLARSSWDSRGVVANRSQDVIRIRQQVVFTEMTKGAAVTAAPEFALSIFNCTLATPTLSLAVTATFTVPERVAFAAGEVIETVGATVSPAVANVMSPLTAHLLLFASVDRARKNGRAFRCPNS